MSASDISGYTELFFQTADEHIAKIEEELKEVLSSSNSQEEIEDIYRRVHSLKGSSSVMGYHVISDMCTTIGDLIHPSEGVLTISSANIGEVTNLIGGLKNKLQEVRL